VSAFGQAIVHGENVRPLIKEARDRQRRRRQSIGGALVLSLGVAALVAAVGGRGSGPSPGSPPGPSAAARAQSSTSPAGRALPALTARDFAKYGISCQALRQADIPGASEKSPWCKSRSQLLQRRRLYVDARWIVCKGTCAYALSELDVSPRARRP